MTYTPDQVASAIIFEGQIERRNTSPETDHGVMSPLQIQIALATALVETNDRVLANPNVPESENYPNDGDGFDHLSTGEFQQQPQWWGTVAEEMDPRLSAAMFYHQLEKDMAAHPDRTPGTYAQDVQGSAYPDRYDQRFNDGVAQYNRLVGAPVASVKPPLFLEDNQIGRYKNFSSRNGRTVDLLVIHTEEPLVPHASAQSLADVIKASEGGGNPVSYHYSIGQNADGTVNVVDMVDTDYECWAVLDSNPDSINYCLAGSSVTQTSQQWMDNFGNAIDVMAYLVVQDAQKYGVPIRFLFPDANGNYPGPPPGITDHKYVTKFLHDGSHTDVGPNFPWAYFGDRINHYAGQADNSGGFLMALTDQQQQQIYDFLFAPQPVASIYNIDANGHAETLTGVDILRTAQGMTQEANVERLAMLGEPGSVAQVVALSQGTPVDGVVPPQWAIDRAKLILKKIPAAARKAK